MDDENKNIPPSCSLAESGFVCDKCNFPDEPERCECYSLPQTWVQELRELIESAGGAKC